MRWTCIVSLLWILLPAIASRHIQFNPEWNTQPGQPGVRMRLTKKGINQLKTVAVKLLNERISRLTGYATDYPFTQPGLEGHVYLTNVRVLQFIPAQISVVNFLPPHSIVFGLENMAVSLAGDFFGQAGIFQEGGSMEGTLEGLTVALTTELRVFDGQMAVNVPNCSTIIANSHFILHPTGPLGPILKIFEGHINNLIRERIPALLCRRLQILIEQNSPKLFARLVKITLEDKLDKKAVAEGPVVHKFIGNVVSGLFMDNRQIAPPIITFDYFESQHKGEIRYEGDNEETPFYPRPMNVSGASDRMIYIFGSDYIFNSFLYHSVQGNKLNLRLDKTNVPPQYAKALQTTCAPSAGDPFGGICVGSLLPGLANMFPNSSLSFLLLPHTMPDFTFNGESAAVGLSSRIVAYVNDKGKEKQVMVASADGQADVILHVEEHRMSGDVKLNKLAVHLHRTISGIQPENIEQLSPLAKTFIGPELSSRLKKGMPFPLKDSIQLMNTNTRIDDGFIELSTDFLINENVLREKIAEAFAGLGP